MVITTSTGMRGQVFPSKRARLHSILAAGIVAGVLHALLVSSSVQAQSMPAVQPSVTPMQNATGPGQLITGPGDLLTVSVFNTPELSGSFRVDQQGRITLPVGGQVTVEGLTSSEAALAIESRLKSAQIMLDPHVTILVTQYATQGVTILGEVKLPGIYPLFGTHSLYDALAVAGGSTQTAGSSITITHRQDAEHPVVIPVDTPNYSAIERLTYVNPGDTIVVSKAESIFVVGDVKLGGQFPMPYGKRLSVLNVLALCQGVNPTAKVSKAAIVRPTADGGAQTIPLDLNKIIRNEEPNPELQASDVLVVPRSGLKAFIEFALPTATGTVISSVSTALIVK